MAEMDSDVEIPEMPLWDELKNQLDEELTPDQIKQMRHLMKDKISPAVYPDLETPSDLLTYLENNMAGDEAWTIVEHVFRITKDYFEFETSSIADIVNKYRNIRARFTCSTFIGRQNDVRDVLKTLNSDFYKGIWIHGLGGIGKTSVAHEVCAKLSEEWEILHVDLKQTTTPLDFVRQILKFVVQSIETSSNLDTLLEMIVLPKEGKHCVLLDNIEYVFLNNKPDTIKVLNRCIELSETTIKWIITCRVPPVHDEMPRLHPEVAEFELMPLDENNSRKLLKIRAKPKKIPQDVAFAIFQSTRGNPLAIGLLGAAIKRSTRDVTSHLISDVSLSGEMESILTFTHDSLSATTQCSLLGLSVVGSSKFDINLARAILETKFDETVMMMIELTNRHVVERVEWRADIVGIKKNHSKPQVELEYCIHPLLLRYLESKQTVENIYKAQQNFCIYVFEKMEKEAESLDINYPLVKDTVLGSDGLYRSMYQVLTKQKFTKSSPLPTNTCIYLSKLSELVHLPEENKIMLYRNIIEQSPENSTLFWYVETMATHIDARRFQEAFMTLNHIESKVENNSTEVDSFTMGFYWYQKGRYFRMKEKFQDALCCHDKAMNYYQMCRYVIGVAHAQNAKGNVYFDRGEYENAKVAHENAKNTLEALVQENDHPDLSTYDFNIGTVCMAIAEQKRRQNSGQTVINNELKQYYETALEKFKESLKRDEVMGMIKSPQYTTKLDNIAWCYYRLGHLEEGIATLKEYVEVVSTPSPTRKTVRVYFTAGKAYMDWSHHSEPDMKSRLFKEAANCFYKVQSILYDGFPAIDLNDTDKRDYIEYFKQLAHNLGRERKREVERFCQSYEAGNLHASDSSSGTTDTSSTSDDGMETDDHNSGEEYEGIPSAELEKTESEKSFLTEANSTPQVGKRAHSSSESD